MNTEAVADEAAWASRDYRPADAPVLYALLQGSLPDEAGFARQLADAWVRVACASDGAVLGFAAIALPGTIEYLIVAPEARRQGIATALLEDLYFLAAAMGSGQIRVDAPEEARPFFVSQGFVAVDGQRLEKRLSA